MEVFVPRPEEQPIQNLVLSDQAVHTSQWLPSEAAMASNDVQPEDLVRPEGLPQEQGPPIALAASSQAINVEYLHQELSFATLIDTQSIQHSKGDEQKSNRGSSSPLGAPSSSLEHLDAGGLPDFIRPLPESLTSIDRDYLRARGALQIPPPDLCDEIIGHYLCYVHPYLPVLYTSTLRQIMHGPHSPRKAGIGLFLFQAVMFSAVHLLDAQAIRRLGFDSPRDARRAFYERVRLLYDFDVEPNRRCVIQSLVLMSLWSISPGDSKGGWHWIGVSVSLALTLGLHKKADYISLDPREGRLRRRIWWSCYIRDRVMALASNRLWRIRDGEFDTPMLTLADFEESDSIMGSPAITRLLSPADQDEEFYLAQLCIGLAQLCTQVCGILDLHFSILPESTSPLQSNDETGNTSPLFYAKLQAPPMDRVYALDQNLHAWFHSRPQSCVYEPVGSKSRIIYNAFVNLVYLAMVSTLYRPLLRRNLLVDFVEYRMLAQRRVQMTTTELARISRDLHGLQLARLAPFAAAMFVMPAVIICSGQLRSSDKPDPRPIFDSIMSCLAVMNDIREGYAPTDMVVTYCLDIMRRSNILAQIDKVSGRVTGLSYGDAVHKSNTPLPSIEDHGRPGDGSDVSGNSVLAGPNSLETGLESGQEHQAGTPNRPHPESEQASRGGGLPQPFGSELYFQTGDADAHNPFNMPFSWDLLPSVDDDWLAVFEADVGP